MYAKVMRRTGLLSAVVLRAALVPARTKNELLQKPAIHKRHLHDGAPPEVASLGARTKSSTFQAASARSGKQASPANQAIANALTDFDGIALAVASSRISAQQTNPLLEQVREKKR